MRLKNIITIEPELLGLWYVCMTLYQLYFTCYFTTRTDDRRRASARVGGNEGGEGRM